MTGEPYDDCFGMVIRRVRISTFGLELAALCALEDCDQTPSHVLIIALHRPHLTLGNIQQ